MGRKGRRRRARRRGAAVKWYASPVFVAVVSIVGVAVAVVSLVVAKAAYDQDAAGKDASMTPRVNVVGHELTSVDDVAAELSEDVDKPTEKVSVKALAVDVVLENLHDQSALITRVDAEVRGVHTVQACGGGPLQITAQYHVRIPQDGAGRKFGSDVKFEVEGKRKDRFVVSVGPEKVIETDLVQIFHLDLLLRLQNGETLRVNDIMLADGGSAEDDDNVVVALATKARGFTGSRECLLRARQKVDQAVAARAATQSPRLAALHARLHAVGY
ncbi:hypothetical protein ACFWN2_01105 [Lentzea sp. NPDC058436]|uniref:hypothetical protein n=1 Tax=Lentzea sp. NPDC058436 TaxID=3346499 RepID=UPI003665AC9C